MPDSTSHSQPQTAPGAERQPSPHNPFTETLTGVLERVTYHNEENGYTVGRLAIEGARDLITIVGNFSNPVVGEQLFCEGKWVAHREFGRQFEVERYSTSKPATAFAIEKYLGSGLIKGIGPVMAKRMVDLFSLDTLDIIENEPRKLLRVEGIGEKRVGMIQKAWDEQREIRNVMLFLQEKGVSATFAVKIYKTYGDRAIATVEENPYRLAQDIWGIGFKTADKIAQQLGVEIDSEQRLEAGLVYTLSEATNFGHLYLPEPKLLQSAAEILSVEPEKLAPVLETMAASQAVLAEDIPEIEMAGRAMRAFYHPALYYTEVGLAAQIRRRLRMPPNKPLSREKIAAWIAKQEKAQGITLSEEQRQAITLALENHLLVLTGGPGTGKTSVTNLIARAFDAQKKRLLLVSPTGRAAKRLSEVTGRDAQTIHRLLKFDPASRSFQYNDTNPLPCDVLIADEVSMLDAVLANNLLKAVPEHAQIVFVGDSDQLPSVGAGNVLGDLLDSEVVPSIRLTQVFRQAQESLIVTNAHRIRQGQFPTLVPPQERAGKNCLWIEVEESMDGAQQVVKLVRKSLPALGYRGDDIQVLSAMHKGTLGVGYLNELLQEALNPADPTGRRPELLRGSRRFRIGDRVIQLVNNYDKNVYNGDVGAIADIKPDDQLLFVRFPEAVVEYDFADYDELQLAYSLSIHKCIGQHERVWTRDRGLVPIKDLQVGEYVYTGRQEVKPILARVPTGRKPVVRITTKMGYRIDVSEDHPLLVCNGAAPEFVIARDLTTDHYVCLHRDVVDPKCPVMLPVLRFKHQDGTSRWREKENAAVCVPEHLDADLAWLLGALIGDGSYRDRRDGTVDFTNQDNEVLCLFRAILERYRLRVGRYKRADSQATRLYVISMPFRQWLQELGLDYSTACQKRVPALLFQASASLKGRFLRGLFDTDGSVGTGTCRACRLTTCSRQLAQDVQELLLSLGIVSYINAFGANAYHISISGTSLTALRDRVGFSVAYKSEKLDQLIMRASSRRSKTNNDIVPHAANHFLYDRVARVEYTGEEEEMYDIEVEGIHSFVANGFVCHNSQGSEYRAVVLVMHSSQYMMLQRNLLYTGLTRARDLCILVGDKRAIGRAVKNDKTTRRYTRLAERLRATDEASLTPPDRLL
jgi:exodeoxyribonuclease V alpha subunit